MRMHNHALELKANFPNIDSVYSEGELKAIKNKFLGYDPERLPS